MSHKGMKKKIFILGKTGIIYSIYYSDCVMSSTYYIDLEMIFNLMKYFDQLLWLNYKARHFNNWNL